MRAFTLALAGSGRITPLSSAARTPATMPRALLLFTFLALILGSWCCPSNESQNGCKIYGNTCKCAYGCRYEYIYKTRRDCNNALKELQVQAPTTYYTHTAPPTPLRTPNICNSLPCLRGYCLQTSNEPGYTCKCDGTGFYGHRCEKACPLGPVYGMVFPHECIII